MKNILAVLLTLTSFSAMATATSAVLKPVPLSAIKKQSEQYHAICQAIKSGCPADSTLWREKGAGRAVYLTSPGPTLIRMNRSNGEWVMDGRWDFSHHESRDNSNDGELTRSEVTLFPALYPLSQTKQAVALVSTWSTGYSGGGREEAYADFLMLKADGEYQTAFSNVPFSSREMIRACFSEQDYAKKSHCHDESWRILTLQFTDEGREYYSWKFITKASDWPSFTDKSAITVGITEKTAYPFQPDTSAQ